MIAEIRSYISGWRFPYSRLRVFWSSLLDQSSTQEHHYFDYSIVLFSSRNYNKVIITFQRWSAPWIPIVLSLKPQLTFTQTISVAMTQNASCRAVSTKNCRLWILSSARQSPRREKNKGEFLDLSLRHHQFCLAERERGSHNAITDLDVLDRVFKLFFVAFWLAGMTKLKGVFCIGQTLLCFWETAKVVLTT